MEMCVGACDLKIKGADSSGPAAKRTRHQDTDLASDGFGALMAELASMMIAARTGDMGVKPETLDGIEGALVSAAQASSVRQRLSQSPVAGRLAQPAGLPDEQAEAEAWLTKAAMPKQASAAPSESRLMPTYSRVASEGDKVLPEQMPADLPSWDVAPEAQGRPLSAVGYLGHPLWDGSGEMPEVFGLKPAEILSVGEGEQPSLKQPVALEGAMASGFEADMEAEELTGGHERLEPSGAVTGQPEPETGKAATKQVKPKASAQVKHAGKTDNEPPLDQPVPVFSLKVQTGQDEGEQLKAAIRNPERVADTLVEQIKDGLPKTVEFRLDPPGLGKMTVVVTSRGEEVCVRFIASSYGSHNVLVNSQDALVHALSQKGLTLAGFFVDHGMAGWTNQPRHEAASQGRTGKPAAYLRIEEQAIGEESVFGSSVLDYRV